MAKCRPSLRVVISALVAVVVLVVASCSFAVSYTISLATVRDLGRTQALSLALTARVRTEGYFRQPVEHIEAMQQVFLQRGTNLPSLLPNQSDPFLAEKVFAMVQGIVVASNFSASYNTVGFVMEDGSGGGSFDGVDPDHIEIVWRNVGDWPVTNMTIFDTRVLRSTGRETPSTPSSDLDVRLGVYPQLRSLARPAASGAWADPILYINQHRRAWIVPAFARLLNVSDDYIGIAIIAVTITSVSDFLREVKGQADGVEAFAVGRAGVLLGSSHAVPFSTIEATTASAVVPSGCSTSSDSSFNADTVFVGCLQTAQSFPYAPLNLAASKEEFLMTEVAQVHLENTDDGPFFIASTPVENRFRFFGVNVILCIPEETVIGDIVAGRNIALGLTACIFLVAAVLSAGLVTVMLNPLADVSDRLSRTAQLVESTPIEKLSVFTEVRRLQHAYGDMAVALHSFTRYVPREVVKDLMQSGELCRIAMSPRMCTMLFCDIAGFTTICERVPLDALSSIVTRFFDRASTIIMRHGGLVDKFIGDCVMAVWGAPFAAPSAEIKAVLAAKMIDWETRNAELANQWDAAGEVLNVRVGVATGQVLAGNMGSEDRMNYTVIGDAVNLASRLEGLNKQLDTLVLVDGATAIALRRIFVLRLLIPVAVVGKAEAVRVHEVVGLAPAMLDGDTVRYLQDEERNGSRTFDPVDSGGFTLERSFGLGSVTSMSGMNHYHSQRGASAVDLLMEAQRTTSASNQPLVCTPEQETIADQHTKGVEMYLRREFDQALEMLQKNAAEIGPNRAADIVMKQCERFLSHRPSEEEFNNGVHSVTEK